MNQIRLLLCSLVTVGSMVMPLSALESLKNIKPQQFLGVFKQNAPRLEGIKWGNWGSRPYEYYWASKVVTMTDKRIIDLGVGLPSQYNWYKYAVKYLKPAYYVGIDADGRMKSEIKHGKNFDMLYMDMSKLDFEDKSFDIAYCISTFEHIPYDIFIKAIAEAHRVLVDGGLLVLTLDEQWDKNIPLNSGTAWNDLEQSLVKKGLFKPRRISFGLTEFLELVKEYFVPVVDDAVIDTKSQTIFSQNDGRMYYHRENRDSKILYSPECYNSCVSYAVLRKVS